MEPDRKIDRLMDRWESGFIPDSALRSRVLEEIDRRNRKVIAELKDSDSAFVEWARSVARQPLFSGLAAAMFVLVGMGLLQFADSRNDSDAGSDERTLSYRLSIDPIYRLQALAGTNERGVATAGPEEEQFLHESLGWLQSELDLNTRQYERVSALHSSYESAFNELFLELLSSYSSYRDLDRKRMSNDVIDYIEFYDLLQKQKRLKAASNQLTSELIEKVSQIVTPEQRTRFQRLIRQSHPTDADSSDPARDKQNA